MNTNFDQFLSHSKGQNNVECRSMAKQATPIRRRVSPFVPRKGTEPARQQNHTVDPCIFRAYDIRGKVPEQINPDVCRSIGQAFGSQLRVRTGEAHPRVAVGRDARTHGTELERATIDGLVATGCQVLRIGAAPTPVNCATVIARRLHGGIQVTASHNPPEDNGLKLYSIGAASFAGSDIALLKEHIAANDLLIGTGSVEELDAETPYRESLAALFPSVAAGLHVVVDGGNGIAGPLACSVLRRLGASVTPLYIDPDGTFPNHSADPSRHETLADLVRIVRKTQAHIGIAFDGDGDRLGIVDEMGHIWTADEIMLLLARDHLARVPGGSIVFTVSNSSMLETEIARWGGQPVMTRVGHSSVEHSMQEHNALLGGEQSGHFFCAEGYHRIDDALVAALRVLRILRTAVSPLSALRADFPTVYQAPERRPRCDDHAKWRVIDAAAAHFATRFPTIAIDGVRMDFGDGAWAGIRASNTSPAISICCEARSPDRLATIERIVLEYLHQFPEIQWE